ncbi:hypothetical protein [Oceanobacillus sp. Castelsardo]|uniref:hypothetical protein n=1 Tax=Oceanobacillus sp. Castelsardo TaxID=1851204 RepID=UPI000838CDC8|nr:hypothetical protein [Oceanobacillus sp. Castelsardo]
MWDSILERFPTLLEWFYTLLAFIVPFLVYKVNQVLHEALDPPWKREEKKNKEGQEQPSQ